MVIRGGDPHGGTAVEQGLEHADGPVGLDSADAVGEFFYVGGVVFGEQPFSSTRGIFWRDLDAGSWPGSPALLGGLAGDAEPGADLGPGVAGAAQAGDGLGDGGIDLGREAEHEGQGLDVAVGDAAGVGP